MGQIDWDVLAIACQANHDLYAAAYDGNEKQAQDAIDRGADPSRIAEWIEDDGARDFLLNTAARISHAAGRV